MCMCVHIYIFPVNTVKQIKFATRRENIADATLQSVNLRQKHASLPCRGNSRCVFLWEINRSSWQYHHRQELLYKDESTALTYSDDRRAARTPFPRIASGIELSFSARNSRKKETGGRVRKLDIVKEKKKIARWQMCASYVKACVSHGIYFSPKLKRSTIGFTGYLSDE